jgi:hypothetical protein
MLYISGSDRTDCRVSERAAVPHVAVSSAIYHICDLHRSRTLPSALTAYFCTSFSLHEEQSGAFAH